ncbi:hypothetical protein T484DRAFT_1957505 [Baffinella frigidus]|nr:hypothetical protein T484DRAFT_1957505 [Cryptophyta sp. CCMP2293]
MSMGGGVTPLRGEGEASPARTKGGKGDTGGERVMSMGGGVTPLRGEGEEGGASPVRRKGGDSASESEESPVRSRGGDASPSRSKGDRGGDASPLRTKLFDASPMRGSSKGVTSPVRISLKGLPSPVRIKGDTGGAGPAMSMGGGVTPVRGKADDASPVRAKGGDKPAPDEAFRACDKCRKGHKAKQYCFDRGHHQV